MLASDEPAVSAIACAEVASGISITLAQYADGWGFYDWQQKDTPLQQQPNASDTSRRFDTSDEALRFFRNAYGWKLEGSGRD